MPQLTLLCFPLNWKIFKLAYLILKLYDESDLCRSTKVSHNQKADHLEEAISAEALFIESHLA